MVGDWPRTRPAEVGRSVIFFGLLYLYAWLVVEPRLIYSCATITNFPVFYKGWPFLWECLSYPGGVLRYVNALLPQFFYYSWAGALVITGQAWALSAGTGWFLRLLGVPGRRVLRFVPALLVLVPYAQYAYHFPTIMGSLVALLFGCLYVVVSRSAGIPSTDSGRALPAVPNSWAGRPCYGVAVYVFLSVVSYVISAAAYLPFAGLCAVYEVLYRRRYGLGLVYLVVAAVLPYAAGVLTFHVSIVNAYTDLLPLSWQIRGWPSREKMIGIVYALYLLPVATAFVWGLAGRVFPRVAKLGKERDGSQPEGQNPAIRAGVGGSGKGHSMRAPAHKGKAIVKAGGPVRPAQGMLGDATRKGFGGATWRVVLWGAELLLVLAAGGGVAAVALDRSQKALLAVHYYACQRMWPEVLQVSQRCPENYTVINAVDRALYYTGRLTRDMFACLQYPEALMLTGEDHSVLYWHKFDTLIDLGLMNLAEKNLTECMETFGEHPLILQRLAIVNLAKGKTEAARIYLGRLSKTLFLGPWAKDYLARLATDPSLAGDSLISSLRACTLRRDSTAAFYAREPMLAALVEQGAPNRMAFEYLMAWYMVTKQLDKFVQNLGRLTEFGYTEVPPLYQEAAVIYAYGTKKPIPLHGLTISREAQQRIERFSSVFNRYRRDKDAAFGELARDFGGSYLFYYIYASAAARK